jgi:hypothetical protein
MNKNNNIQLNNNINHNKNNSITSLYINKNDNVLPFSFWIKSMVSFRFISNLSIILSFISYYMNAYEILFIVAPLVIVNCIIIFYIMLTDLDELMKGILEKKLPNKIDRDNYKCLFVIFIILWHLLPIVWLYYVFDKDNLIKYFRPNFMGTYFKSLIICILYYYYESNEKIYGDLNYLFYFIIYIILLLGICISLYM